MGSNQVDDASRVYSCRSDEHSMVLLDSLNQQRKQGVLCDTKIEVENRTFACHSNVLAASLGYFRDLLKKDQLPGFHRITEIVKATGFSKILDFVYTSQLKLSQNTVLEVMCAAAYLQSSFVVSKCNEFVARRPGNQPPLVLTDDQKDALAHLPKPQSASELLHQLSNQNITEPKSTNSVSVAGPGSSRMRNNNHQHQQHVRKASSPKRLRDNDYDVMTPTGGGGGLKRRMPTPRPDTASPSATHHLMNGGGGAVMTSASTSPFHFGAVQQQLMNQQQQHSGGSSSSPAIIPPPNSHAGVSLAALSAAGGGGSSSSSQLGGFFNFNSASGAQPSSSDHNSNNGNGGAPHHNIPSFALSMYQGAQQGEFQQQQHRDMQPGTSSDLQRQQSEHSPFQHLLSTMPTNGGSSSPSNGGTDLMTYQRGGGTSQAAAMRLMTSSLSLPSNNRVVSAGTYTVGMALAPSSDRRVAIPGDDAAGRRSRSDRADPRTREKKEYFCTMCPKSFGRQQHLKRHILTHTGERPYPCKLCEKRFRRSEHLKHHMTSHTNSDGTAVVLPQPKRRRRREPTDIYQMSRNLLAANAVHHGGSIHFPLDGSQSNYPYPSTAVILPLMASAIEGNGPTLTEIPNNNGDVHHHLGHSTSSQYDVNVSVNLMPDDRQVTVNRGSNIKIEEIDPEDNQSPSHETSAATLNGSSPHEAMSTGDITSRPGSSAATNSNSSGSPSMPDAAMATAVGTGSSGDECGATSSPHPMTSHHDHHQQPDQAVSYTAKSSPLVDVENSEVLTEDMKQLMRSMSE